MRELKLPMNTVVYNALIDSQARCGEIEGVSMLIAGMEKDGCTPDSITYSTIVKAYCIKGELDKALEVFRDMQGSFKANDCIVYNTMLDGATRHNRMDLADIVLEEMEKSEVRASNVTLGILVKMYGRRHMLDKAFQAVEEMPGKHGIMVNAHVLTCLISACINDYKLDRAFKVYNDWHTSGLALDARAYDALVSGCVRQGRAEQAARLVEEACDLVSKGSVNGKLANEPLEHLLRALSQEGRRELPLKLAIVPGRDGCGGCKRAHWHGAR
jgi:pentatricopeptide repeat protein